MIRSSAVVVAVLLVVAGRSSSASEGWLVDLDAAKAQASKEGKNLLMDFTGSDWCFWCKKLDGEVFQEAEFREKSVDQFVLVMLDYPQDKSGQSEEVQAQNARLKELYAISGYPTVILADADGRPFAKTGYKEGGASAYLKHLDTLEATKLRFDKALVRAESEAGVVRARRLDEALAMIPGAYLAAFYGDLMRDVIDSDPDDEAGLGARYRELIDSATRKLALETIAKLVEAREDGPDWSGLIADMDAVLTKYSRIPIAAQKALLHKGRAMLELGDLEGGLAALIAGREAFPKGEAVAVLDRMIEDVRDELDS